MFYKLMDGNCVVDVLTEALYMRYLPQSKRWMNTDKLSANGILGSNGSTIYHILGHACACPDELVKVRIVQIDEQEYQTLVGQLSVSKAENAQLKKEIVELKEQLNEQSRILQLILQKL